MSSIETLKIKAKLLLKAKKRAGISIQLKDALDIVARSLGFHSWRDLKTKAPENELFGQATGVFPNHWCKTYEEAQSVLNRIGGFILPYRAQFFVCAPDYIEAIGIRKDDPDLNLIGNDWVRPKDAEAFERLRARVKSQTQRKRRK